MKGVILAGGLGTRLYPFTRVVNKHLLPVYDKPMIFYPIQALVNAGINEVMLVVGGKSSGKFLELLGDGREHGLEHLSYAYQIGEGGIADALRLAKGFVGDDQVTVFLGDNVIEGNISDSVAKFQKQKKGARILLKEVEDTSAYGIAELDRDRILSIEEKPENPKSNLAVTGIYMYNSEVFDIIESLKPSHRGELEITDLNNIYVKRGQMYYDFLQGWWADAAVSYDELLRISCLVAKTGANKIPFTNNPH